MFIYTASLLLLSTVSAGSIGYSAPSFSSGGGGFSSGGFISDDGFDSGESFISSGGFSSGGFSSGGFSSGGFSSGGSFGGNFGGSALSFNDGCGNGLVRKADGNCVEPQVTRNIYLYAAPPAQQVQVGPAPQLPNPKVHYNFVFVRTPQVVGGSRPIVVPPPKQKTLVYVLSKRPDAVNQEVIEVPSQPTQPEVFFVNYNQGDNPQLPGGIDLQQALSQSQQQGQIIDGGSNFGGSSGGFISGGSSGGFISGGSSGGFIDGGSSGGFISGGGISGGYSAPSH